MLASKGWPASTLIQSLKSTVQSQADKGLTMGMPCLQEIHAVTLVYALEGGAPDVQVERRSTAGTGSGMVELKVTRLENKQAVE